MASEFERAQSSPEADVARGTKEELQKHVWNRENCNRCLTGSWKIKSRQVRHPLKLHLKFGHNYEIWAIVQCVGSRLSPF